MTHLKTIASSTTLKVPRKEKAWLLKSAPGPHKADESMSMTVLLRDYLGLADNRKEARYILRNKEILVDGRRVTDDKFAVGLLDIVCMKEQDKCYIILVDHRGRLYPKEISKKDAEEKVCKIIGKTMLKGGKLQLNLYDGKNIIISPKDSKKYAAGGSLVLKLPETKITAYIDRAKGKMALVAKGRHAGKIGKIVEMSKSGLNLKSLTTLDVDGEQLVTDTDYIIMVGDTKSRI
jgi:small subunit ribosomal protein S4e